MSTNRTTRRMPVLMTVALALATVVPFLSTAPPAAASESLADSLGIPAEMIPGDFGQTSLQVYIPQTHHTIRGTMLDYWRANGSASVYGNPISEPYGSADGYYSQAFERGIFRYLPDYAWSDDPATRLENIGTESLNIQRGQTRADGRRANAADPRLSNWRPATDDQARANKITADGGQINQTTGHSLTGAFLKYWNTHEGWFYLGNPLSEPMRARGAVTQYFEAGVLMYYHGQTWLAPLPAEHPERFGIDTKSVKKGKLKNYSEALFQTAPNPSGVDTTNLTGRRHIEVSLSQQTLYAYQGDTLVLQTLVSTGLAPNLTLPGEFHVRLKMPMESMAGFTDSTGETAGFTDPNNPGAAPAGDSYWVVPDVPNVMYFQHDGEALHGTYWHHNFGNPMSHGCVNLPLDVAAWMYGWAPLGTEVTIYQ